MAEETQNQETTETTVKESAEQAVENKAVETPAAVEAMADKPGEVKVEEIQSKPAAQAIEESVVVKEPGIIEGALKKGLPELRQGDMVKVYQKIKEVKDNKTKERIQIFEGQILAMKHGKGITGTITVRKVVAGIGVEKIFPIHSPSIEKIEITKQTKTRRAKLYFLRTAKGRKAKLKATTHKGEAEESEESVVEE
jgi:large subunit ribosomal protein L19